MRFEMDKSVLHTNQTQHILSAAEGGGVALATPHGRFIKTDACGAMERECRVSLEERDLWSKFQELTNEMIVTKNGRYIQIQAATISPNPNPTLMVNLSLG